jgi:hypothetical protein
MLRANRFSLDAFSFLPQGEPYSVLDSPEDFADGDAAGTEKVYVFDRKV